MLTDLLLIIGGYLLGSVSSAIVICRLLGLPDPRSEGSGNPGATNVLRLGARTRSGVCRRCGSHGPLAGDARVRTSHWPSTRSHLRRPSCCLAGDGCNAGGHRPAEHRIGTIRRPHVLQLCGHCFHGCVARGRLARPCERVLGGQCHESLLSLRYGYLSAPLRQRAVRAPGKHRAEVREFNIEPALLPLLRTMHAESEGKGVVAKMPPVEDLAATFRQHLERAGLKRAALY